MLGKYIKNVLISSIISFIILTLFCSVYYNVPVHHTNEDGSTDYSWESKVLYSSMTEGFGIGRTNNEGYMNVNDYNEEMVDVLIMGSSHLQGLAVPLKDTCVSIMNEQLKDKQCYSIAIAGHNFKVCLNNLDNALKKYKPSIVVIEMDSLLLDEEEINKVINNEIPEITSVSNEFINFLQHNQFLRLMYSQINSFKGSSDKNNQIDSDSSNNTFNQRKAIQKLMNYIVSISDTYNTDVIILYNPNIALSNEDGMIINENKNNIEIYKEACEENDIVFLDMSKKYMEEFLINNILPVGFNNTSIGVGHINKNGHKMIAEELVRIIGGNN